MLEFHSLTLQYKLAKCQTFELCFCIIKADVVKIILNLLANFFCSVAIDVITFVYCD